MVSRTTVLLITTAAMAVVFVGALLPATASADEDGDDDEDTTGSVDTVVVTWDLEEDYNKWATEHTLYVGEVLEFQYDTGGLNPHNLVWVDEGGFNSCNPGNFVTLTSGDDIVSLTSSGQWYFISSLNGDCLSGMKLKVNVAQQ